MEVGHNRRTTAVEKRRVVAVFGGVLRLGASVAGSRAGGKRGVLRHSVFKHVAAHCNVLRQWMLHPKTKKKSKKVVVAGRTVLLSAAVCCNAFKWVASKFRYIHIYDNRCVNRNRCVCKDNCIWDLGECMKAKVNYSYEQNKDISTGAVADGEKANTTVDRATCLCIR